MIDDIASKITKIAEWASILGLVASIASFVISALALRGISRVRQELIVRTMLPGMISNLEQLNSQGNEIITKFDVREDEYAPLMAKCIASLRSLSVLKNSAAEDARRAQQMIENFIRPKKTGLFWINRAPVTLEMKKKLARSIYTELNLLIEEMKRLAQLQNLGG